MHQSLEELKKLKSLNLPAQKTKREYLYFKESDADIPRARRN